MSMDGHLTFKNVLVFLQKQNTKNTKQNIGVGMPHGYCLSHGSRLQWSAELILSGYNRMFQHSVPHCIDEGNESWVGTSTAKMKNSLNCWRALARKACPGMDTKVEGWSGNDGM